MSGDYKVGYKKPPEETRFKPGQSGNPKGRPKGAKSIATLLADILEEKITLREGDRVRRVSKAQAMLLAQTQKAIKGDTRAFDAVLKLTASDAPSPEGRHGVLIVPAQLEPEEWAKAAEQQQARWRGNADSDGKP